MATDLAPLAGTVGGGFLIGLITAYGNQVGSGNIWSDYCCCSIFGISANP